MALLLHYTGQDYISRGLLNTQLTPGSTSAIVGGGKTGKGFAFDGTANSALSSQLDEERTIHSFSVWFRILDIYTTRFIMTFGEVEFLQFMLWQRTNGEFVFGYCNDEGTPIIIILNSNLPRGVWYHFAVSINGLEMKLYMNGSLITTHTAMSIRKGSNKILKIGGGTTSSGMIGQICNLKYYNHALSAREVAEDYKTLMLHYKLDKPITTQVFDYSGFNRHIAVIENTTTNSTTEKRVYGGSLRNNGTQGLYGTCDLSDMNGVNEFSLSLHFYKNTTANQCLLRNYTNQISGYGVFLLLQGTSQLAAYIGGQTIIVGISNPINSWIHIVITKSPTQIKVYNNGILVHTIDSTSSSLNYSNQTFISTQTTSKTNSLNGNVQDIRFYAKALTQEDVTELYQTRHMVDKDSNCYTYELIEGQATVGMNKQGQLLCDEIIENEDGVFQIGNNKTIKTKEFKEI